MTTTPTMPTITPVSQEELDEEAVRAYVRLKSYRKAAEATCLTRMAVYRRVQRWLKRSEQRRGGTPMAVSDLRQ